MARELVRHTVDDEGLDEFLQNIPPQWSIVAMAPVLWEERDEMDGRSVLTAMRWTIIVRVDPL